MSTLSLLACPRTSGETRKPESMPAAAPPAPLALPKTASLPAAALLTAAAALSAAALLPASALPAAASLLAAAAGEPPAAGELAAAGELRAMRRCISTVTLLKPIVMDVSASLTLTKLSLTAVATASAFCRCTASSASSLVTLLAKLPTKCCSLTISSLSLAPRPRCLLLSLTNLSLTRRWKLRSTLTTSPSVATPAVMAEDFSCSYVLFLDGSLEVLLHTAAV